MKTKTLENPRNEKCVNEIPTRNCDCLLFLLPRQVEILRFILEKNKLKCRKVVAMCSAAN